MAALSVRQSGPSRILVVEDEDMIAIDLQDLLEEGGYRVLGPAATVATALALIDRDAPDACVLDVNLRGEISIAVAQRLKERGVPFLLSSAYKRDFLDDHVAFNGMTNIGKPASSNKLLSVLAFMLGRNQTSKLPAQPQ